MLEIVRAEDEKRFDHHLERLLRDKSSEVRKRAALAAGRIGNERAVKTLVSLAESDPNESVRLYSVFALGEIESLEAAEVILRILRDEKQSNTLRAFAVEAAGKIVHQSKPNSPKARELAEAITEALELEFNKSNQNKELILLGLTSLFRSKPDNADEIASMFLTHIDPNIRINAANALARLQSKKFTETLRFMLLTDPDPIVRANAARALAAAEDKSSAKILLETAVSDDDLRARVSALRALSVIRDKESAEKLIERANLLLALWEKSAFRNPVEKNELLEIVNVIGLCLLNSDNEKVIELIKKLRKLGRLEPEIEISFARISPKLYLENLSTEIQNIKNWRDFSATSQALETFADATETLRQKAINNLIILLEKAPTMAQPVILSALVSLRAENAEQIVRQALTFDDVFVRAKAAELITKFPANEANTKTLVYAFRQSMTKDIEYDDAQLAILSAIAKLDKEKARQLFQEAFSSPNYLVRRHAFLLMREHDESIREKFDQLVGTVKHYKNGYKTKLGQVINSKDDYLRAISRKNGSVRALVKTEKGNFKIELKPEDAPLTVDNFIKLAHKGFFNGVEIHRVVPNFVIQDGDPRGDSNGGPGWQIRCEINSLRYERGAVGMALSGKDTGGSQWFVTHSPQPHLDGGYTIFGYIDENDMKVVDSIVRGDKILKVEIIENKRRNIKKISR